MDIWKGILKARIVIADITDRNPNVFYELGIAHTLGKPVILLTQKLTDIPFDLNRFRHIVYQDNLDGYDQLTKHLRASIREIIASTGDGA
jgi:nucleoside 2-deoxyribosyltransferase